MSRHHGVAATGYGGGVASAVARALGEGDADYARAVAGNAALLGVTLGTVWALLMLGVTPA